MIERGWLFLSPLLQNTKGGIACTGKKQKAGQSRDPSVGIDGTPRACFIAQQQAVRESAHAEHGA